MEPKYLSELISRGESTTLEFKRKSASPLKIAREISAFANTRGGILLIGVNDDGTLRGVPSEKAEIDIVDTACKFFLIPEVNFTYEVVNVSEYEILAVFIDESENKPVRVIIEDEETGQNKHRAFIRVGEKSIEASREMYRLLKEKHSASKPLVISIGEREKRLFTYLEKRERATVKDFSRLVNISERRAERLLIKLVRAGVLQIHSDDARDYFTLRAKVNY